MNSRKFARALSAMLSALLFTVVACGGADTTPTVKPTETQAATSVPTAQPQATTPPTAAPTRTAAPAPTATAVSPTATAQATATPTKTVKTGGTLRTYFIQSLRTYDNMSTRSSPTWSLIIPIMDFLVENYQAGDGVRPGLAKSWDISSSGLTYTFRLFENAKWHDGKPVTADDVVYFVNRAAGRLDLATPAYKSTFDALNTVEKIDATSVRMTLKRVSASFLAGIGTMGNTIYPAHIPISDFPQHPIGSGPFTWVSYQTDVKGTLKRNPNYHQKDEQGRQLPYLDGLEIFVIPDTTTAYAAFTTNQLDVSFLAATPNAFRGRVDQVKQRIPGVQSHRFLGTHGVLFRNKEPWTDQRVRRAFMLALDRQAVNDTVFQGTGTPYMLYNVIRGAWVLPDEEIARLPGYNKDTRQKDVAEANQLLDAFLKDTGQTRSSFVANLMVLELWKDYATAAAETLRQNLGITFKLDVVPNAQLIPREASGAFDMDYAGIGPGFDDPSTVYGSFFRTNGGTNFGLWSDPTLDAKFDKIDTTLDKAERQKLTREAELELYQRAWYVPADAEPNDVVAFPYVKGDWKPLLSQDGAAWQRTRIWMDK